MIKYLLVELGLSSDTYLADTISELETRTFLTNSDAHSLPKIAREYNKMEVEDISFKEVVKALKNEDGRRSSGKLWIRSKTWKIS